MNRRTFLMLGAGTACGIAFGRLPRVQAQTAAEPFKISLAEWSLVQTLKSGAMTNLDFPRVAKEQFKIDCIEFVDQFFADKAKDKAYLAELTQRAKDAGVTMGLIMLDTPGALGVRSENIRAKAVAKTCEWIDAAHELGCYAIRINARGGNDPNELRGAITESCAQLADYAAQANIDVCIENHGGPSSDPEWLVSVMKAVGKPNFGTLPDFGNFPPEIDRYDAVEKMMPYAKAVSAKATSFTPDKRVAETDYFRMMRIVRDAGWTKYVGVESGASDQAGEAAAIEMTRDLLLQIREEQKRCQPIFNGTSLDGWVAIEGGEWAVEEGVLIGRNGQKWSTNPEVTGSWLRTQDTYGDFRLELQYTISENGNSGVFFRSAEAKNPAFTGYEMQIYDAPGSEPSKGGPTSIYDVLAPTENRVRPAGQWNTVTITAKGPHVAIDVNGGRVIDADLDRSMSGFIGLQNHDEKAVVRFRNIRVEQL